MKHSIRSATYSHGLADLMTELLGVEAEDIIVQRTPLGRGTVHRRLTGESDWTVREIILLSDLIGVTPSRLVSAMSQVAVYGADLGQTAISLAHAAMAGETR
ncbi:hypothetical protein [Nesterenkonia sp. Act20]|uniref:hypothetical protein n=1 Tax=Nesterenkonia sp. Act20 TaxID=1483432 RepID=UPI001C476010|nr:hypothetical protein [Nesterenkonia sp. Act20]